MLAHPNHCCHFVEEKENGKFFVIMFVGHSAELLHTVVYCVLFSWYPYTVTVPHNGLESSEKHFLIVWSNKFNLNLLKNFLANLYINKLLQNALAVENWNFSWFDLDLEVKKKKSLLNKYCCRSNNKLTLIEIDLFK